MAISLANAREDYLFDNLGTTNKYYVEFGTQNATRCNTRNLWEEHGWDGTLIDAGGIGEDARIIRNHFVTEYNIVDLFRKYDVPKDLGLLSVDIDTQDVFVLDAILRAQYHPRVIVTENHNFRYDESYPLTDFVTSGGTARSIWSLMIDCISTIKHSPIIPHPAAISATKSDSASPASSDIKCTFSTPNLTIEAAAIVPLPKPEFSLLDAWLKGESARYGPAPKTIPDTLLSEFTMNDTVPVFDAYIDQASADFRALQFSISKTAYLGGKALAPEWTVAKVDEIRAQTRARNMTFNYNSKDIYDAYDVFALSVIRGKRGLVIGSEWPWMEAMLLEYGAEHVSTLEFGTIVSLHPKITTYTPKDFTLGVLRKKIAPFDFVVSYSSLEHDGLGRYGDVLNPIGDLQTMAKMLSVLKPGGYAFIGVPCCVDSLVWNVHRKYGPLRLKLMFAGYRLVEVFPRNAFLSFKHLEDGSQQGFFVVQNTYGCSNGWPREPNSYQI
ncbi:hypothetical protein SmJEL517_g02715 [Synchytrium microbalum]|uniref:Uncharacterized protein n=1 Tax=Synchytrium microbalum TaxID=1806994 RepID=A0A507C5W0_9FUNG|nr:uncharacterized protein SmJEL517_g02715 [Synchytrium microbalum]TPX34738.1 hypothetical protein SmJEL517_g02715 [Synchytrium microbalum]